jgi:ABC-type branched-subunit amino acid transport system ATPase component/ABC-type branched-subunit amino acid transport system permease subunit
VVDGAVLAQLCAHDCINRQVVFDGATQGLVYGLLAMGIVLIYRSTKVVNFAVGNMGLPGAALFALMVVEWNAPFWLSLVLCLLAGALLAAIVELTVVRRLFRSPRVILLVATVGVAQLMQLIVTTLPDVSDSGARYPVAVGRLFEPIRDLRMPGAKLTTLVVVLVVAALLAWVLNRTTFGKAVAASADNPDLGRLSGVNPKVISTFVWTMGGVLSTLSMILLSGGGSVAGVLSLGPLTLARALTAAVIAGMRSFPRAVMAGVLVGIVEAALRFNFLAEPGLIDFVLVLAVLVAVYVQSRHDTDGGSLAGFSPKVRQVPERLKAHWYVRNMGSVGTLAFFAIAALGPLLHTFQSSQLLLYTTIVVTAISALSVTVITGWSGQLSLAQMTFAGIGALTAAALSRGLELDIGWRSARILQFQLPPIPFGVAIVVAALTTGLLAALIGVGALRVRGLLLAVSTFAFAIAAQQYLYRRPIFSDGRSSVLFERGKLFGLDISDQRTYYYVCLGGLAIVFAVVARLRRSGIGRTTLAVRDNGDTASAYTVSPTRTKLTAFALAGAIAGFGGGLLGGLVRNIRYTETYFLVSDSLKLVAIVVIGGLGSIFGPVLGALWVLGLPAFWPENDIVPLLSSSIGLLLVLMYFPGGLVQIVHAVRDGLLGWVDRRFDHPEPTKRSVGVPPSLRRTDAAVELPAVVLATRELTVRYGGIMAVHDVALEVGRDEIVGLIGTNGAGKTTLMNAIGGFVRATGSVELLGAQVSDLHPRDRARRGLGRTFQAATLFPELTVRETVQVALEARGRTSFTLSALHLDRRVERRRAAEAADLIDFLGLGRYADTYISELSTGTRRIVEIADLLALEARLLCLDEPTAGVAQRESEAFGPLIQTIRAELGASILIIEHDMPLVMTISDRVYCLEAGSVIAEGAPAAVRDDPAVVASYLGTDERAIARSGALDPSV